MRDAAAARPLGVEGALAAAGASCPTAPALGLRRVERALDLPEAWDALAGCLFQRRAFLEHTETHNPCAQRYWLLERDARLVAGAVVYTLPLDLLTFARIPSPVRMQVVGVPCSVSASGVLGEEADRAALLGRILGEERGLVLGLNLEAPLPVPGLQFGRTLPTVVLARRFASWDEYLGSLNAAYRRRLRRSAAAFQGLARESGTCARYDAEAHALYLQVFGRSRAKLERLSLDFFRSLPAPFTFTTYRRQGALVGWHVCAREGSRFYFFLGGLDYRHNRALDIYFNLLASVLREGIEAGAAEIDFGQTAEVPKTRLGGALVEKHLFAWHPNPLLRAALRAARGALEYGTRVPEAHPFRDPTPTERP